MHFSRSTILFSIMGVIILVIACIGGWFLWMIHAPLSQYPSSGNQIDEPRRVTIPAGTNLNGISEILRSEGALHSSIAFKFSAILSANARNLKAGSYIITPEDTIANIVRRMALGESEDRVVLPEGITQRQIALLLAEKRIIPDTEEFEAAARDFAAQTPLIEAETMEGYLFPDTYQILPGTDSKKIVSLLYERFREVTGKAILDHRETMKKSGLTLREVIILASMIEREAKLDEERSLIASVYLNRIRKDYYLNCDATIHYALNAWDRPLTRQDLRIDSPFNTYTRKGFPPHPIGNPGIKSILAALDPPETPLLYYVARGDGSHQFSKTKQEHDRAVRAWREFLQSRGTSELAE